VNLAKFEYFRNLRDYPYPTNSSEYIKYEQEIINRVALTLNQIEKENTSPFISNVQCIKYSDDSEKFNLLINDNKIKISTLNLNKLVLFVLKSDLNISSFILLNDSSHVRIISTTKQHSNIFSCYERLHQIHKALDFQLHFEFDNHLGYLNSDITLLGNAISFSSDVVMKKLLEKDNTIFEEVKKFFHGHSITGDKSGLISFSINQNLNETENDFLERVFQQIYNLNYIEGNVSDAKIQNLTHKIEEYEKKAVSYREKKFFNSLKLAYENSLPVYQYAHFYPFYITLNTIILNVAKHVNMVNIYRHFPNFLNSFIMNYRQVYDDVINRKTLSNVTRNLEDFRDSLANLDNFTLDKVKKLSFTIRRNLNLGDYEESEEELFKIISDSVNYISTILLEKSDFHEDSNSHFFYNRQIGIHINRLDTLTFTLNISENSTELIKVINNFFKIYKEISNKLIENKITYSASPNTAYYTSDLSYLGTGLTYLVELSNPDKLEFTLNAIHEKDGFYVEKTDDSILLGCNLNVNIGIYRIFNVTIELFKHLKILTVTEKAKKTLDYIPVEDV
jgi:protein-arginine kinase